MVKYFEIEGKIFKLAEGNVTTVFDCYVPINRCNVIDEDGIFDDKEVHKGDVIATFYNDNPNEAGYIIFDKDSSIAEKAARIKAARLEKHAEVAQPIITDEAI